MEENKVNEIEIEYLKIMEGEVRATTTPTDVSQDWDFQQLNGYEVKDYGKAICRATDQP